MSKGYLVRRVSEAETVPCLCGSSTRPLTVKDTSVVNLHIVHIQDSLKHYHRECHEVYYILEGSGKLELGDDEIDLEPGMVILIEPGTAHRGRGDFRAVVVGVPGQRVEDEILV